MNRIRKVSPLSIASARWFGHKPSVIEDESFMNKYYDTTAVPKESELDPEEFKTRLESWYQRDYTREI